MLNENTNVKINMLGDTLTAHISGEIDHHSAKGIRETVDSALISYSPDELIMDLSGVSFMDSSGLGLVLGRYTKATDAHIGFSLCGVDARTEKIFDMAGLDRIINYKEKKKNEKDM